jgi:hypothetical protein
MHHMGMGHCDLKGIGDDVVEKMIGECQEKYVLFYIH